MLEIFLKALTEYYPTDPVAPGIVLAWLPEKRRFYCSVKRYRRPGLSKILAQGEAITSQRAIELAMQKWKDSVLKDSQPNLRKLFPAKEFHVAGIVTDAMEDYTPFGGE